MKRALSALTIAFVSFGDAHAQTTLFFEDFEDGLAGWTAESIWHVEEASQSCMAASTPFPSGSKAAWFGLASTCAFATSPPLWFVGNLTLQDAVALPADAGSIELSFSTRSDAEDDVIYDIRTVSVSSDGTTWNTLPRVYNSDWAVARFDLSAYADGSIRLRFRFDAGDSGSNDTIGWLLDDVRIVARPEPAVGFCFGDGSWTPCPCGNSGADGHGCATSFNGAGAHLTAAGMPSIASDTLVLQASGMSAALATIAQGSGMHTLFSAIPQGDGLSCLSGSLIRIRMAIATGGNLQYPNAGELPISIRGAISSPGSQRYDHVVYRNAAAFCTSGTSNITNAVAVTWRP